MSRRISARIAATIVAVALLAGCASIPTDSGVIAGPLVDDTVESGVNFLPEGPVAGADQERILQDFVAAATGPQRNYETARLFLSRDFESKWNPNESVLIRQGSTVTTRTSDVSLQYTISSSASVDSSGIYAESITARPQTLQYSFVQEGGEWRIEDAPQGIILSRGTFEQIFQPHPLYFFDSTFKHLVPDLRWFAVLPTLSVRITQVLLAGQADWLRQGATVSSFPEGTQVSRVATLNGVATVDLSQEVLSANATDKQRMQLQLTRSLGNVPSIQTVQMTVGNVPVAVSPGWNDLASRNQTVDARPLVLNDDEFGYETLGSLTAIDGVSPTVVDLEARAVSLSSSRKTAVVLNSSGVWVVRASVEDPLLVDARRGLIAPAIDSANVVWSIPRSSPTALKVFELDGTAYDVASSLSEDDRVVSLELSRDGSRVVFGLATSAGPRVVVAAVIRNPDSNIPVGLGPPFDLSVSDDPIIDVAWISELAVAVLSSEGDGASVAVYTVAGRRDQRGSPGPATTIVGGNNGIDGMWVLTAGGSVLTPRGSGWLASGMSATLLATQQ